MKKITLIFGFALLFGLFAINNNVNGQAVVIQDGVAHINTGSGIYESTSYHAVITPSGNFKVSTTFMIDPNDPILPEKGVKKIPISWWYNGEFVVDEKGLFFANGKVMTEFTFNGSGGSNP